MLTTEERTKLDERKKSSKLQHVAVACLGLGLLLLAGSFAFRYAVSPDVLWSDEQADEFLVLRAEYHNLAFAEGEESDKFQQSRAAYESQRGELDRAIAWRNRTPALLRLAGIAASVIGITILCALRSRSG